MEAQLVISIPGTWQNRQAIMSSLIKTHPLNYLFVGDIFLETATRKSCLIEIKERARDLVSNYQVSGEEKISAVTLNNLKLHQQIVYLIFNCASYETCVTAARFAKIFLDLGGLAVKVESAGIAHDRTTWLKKYNSDDVFDIYSLFVVLVEDEDRFYSCGMQNFGKPDVCLDATEEINLAIYVMNVFNYYRLTEYPILKDGQTFQPDLETSMYKIKWIKEQEYEPEDLLYNIYGRWHLSSI